MHIKSPRGSIGPDLSINDEEYKDEERLQEDDSVKKDNKNKRKKNKKASKIDYNDMKVYGKPNSIKFSLQDIGELSFRNVEDL